MGQNSPHVPDIDHNPSIFGVVAIIVITFTILVEVSLIVNWSSVQVTGVNSSSLNIPVEYYSSENKNQSH